MPSMPNSSSRLATRPGSAAWPRMPASRTSASVASASSYRSPRCRAACRLASAISFALTACPSSARAEPRTLASALALASPSRRWELAAMWSARASASAGLPAYTRFSAMLISVAVTSFGLCALR